MDRQPQDRLNLLAMNPIAVLGIDRLAVDDETIFPVHVDLDEFRVFPEHQVFVVAELPNLLKMGGVLRLRTDSRGLLEQLGVLRALFLEHLVPPRIGVRGVGVHDDPGPSTTAIYHRGVTIYTALKRLEDDLRNFTGLVDPGTGEFQ